MSFDLENQLGERFERKDLRHKKCSSLSLAGVSKEGKRGVTFKLD